MTRTILLAAALLVGAGCAPATVQPEPTPTDRLDAAVAAVNRQEPATALQHLRAVVAAEPGGGRERLARLLGAAVALDPRNPDHDPDLGATLAAGYRPASSDDWGAALARTLFVLALYLGAAPEPRVIDAAPLAPLPALSVPALTSRLSELEDELERIRKTLEPE